MPTVSRVKDGSVWSRRVAPLLAITLGGITLGLGVASVVLDHLTHQAGTGGPAADAFATAAAIVPVAAVGTLLAARRPRNPIGWMLLAIGIIDISPTGQYLVLDYRMHHGTLPLGWLAAVIGELWPIFLVLVTLLLWLFPGGTLPRGRWHRLAVFGVVGWLLLGLAASSQGVLAAAGDIRVKVNGDLANPEPRALLVLDTVVIVATLIGWVAWLAVQVPTYRHASGEHRQQLKWLYTGAAIFVVSAIIGVFIVPLATGEAPGWGTQPVVTAVTTLGTAALPICMGVAVLKYRLYELNRVISRVVSYTLITALLGGVFAGLILLADHVLPVKGSVAVAVATLVIAALFNPLRRRVQRVVDRRFNRSRYDAEAVVAAFTTRLRHTVDLDALRHDLVDVTRDAFQPAHVSVWLAPAPASEHGRQS
jgi:hypothetical protein